MFFWKQRVHNQGCLNVWIDAPSKHSGWQTNKYHHQHCPRTQIKENREGGVTLAAVVVTARRLLVLYWTSTGLHLFSSSYIMDYVRMFCALYRKVCNCFPQYYDRLCAFVVCTSTPTKHIPDVFYPFLPSPITKWKTALKPSPITKWKTALITLDHIVNYDPDRLQIYL